MVKKDKFDGKSNDEILQYSRDLLDEIRTGVTPKLVEQYLLEELLKQDGYFADEFNAQDFVQMKYNISMDFSIFCSTSLNDKINDLEERLEKSVRAEAELIPLYESRGRTIEHLEQKLAIHSKIHDDVVNMCVTPALQQSADRIEGILGLYSAEKIIMAKLHTGCALTEEEVKLVASKL
jgi:hypothetical protein